MQIVRTSGLDLSVAGAPKPSLLSLHSPVINRGVAAHQQLHRHRYKIELSKHIV
jgi:hypothetical protein